MVIISVIHHYIDSYFDNYGNNNGYILQSIINCIALWNTETGPLEFGLYEDHVWLIKASEHTRSRNEREYHIHERQIHFLFSKNEFPFSELQTNILSKVTTVDT